MERAGHVRRVGTNDHASTVHLPNTEQAENARDFLDLPSILKEIIKLGCSSRWFGFTDRLRKQRQCGSESGRWSSTAYYRNCNPPPTQRNAPNAFFNLWRAKHCCRD